MSDNDSLPDRKMRPAPPFDPIKGTGIMSQLVRNFDWGASPLGPISSWSDTLISNVNQILFSPIPAVLSWGRDFTMIYNEAAIPALQGKHPGALGASFREVYAEVWQLVGQSYEDCYHRGTTVIREDMLIPLVVDGHRQDQWFTFFLIPIFEEGAIAGVYSPYQNNTAKVRADLALQAAQRQLHQILEGTTDSVLSLDRSWNVTYLNGNAKRFLAPYGDLIGRNFWEAFPDTQYENSPFVHEYRKSMDEGLPGEFEAYYPNPAGWYQVLSRPTLDGITVFFRDITASKKAASAFIESEKLAAIGRLSASIAHEINNPLESVINLIYLARRSDSFEDIRTKLDIADHELRRAAEMTNQTLRYYKQETSATSISPATLLANVVAIYQGRLVGAEINLETRYRETRHFACFESEIRQVLSNLVGNAIDAMGAGIRCLKLRVREGSGSATGNGGVVFTVADSGTGMPPETVARIFEAFFSTKGLKGTGLGLWISREIVERHSGSMRVRSSQRAGSEGTVFTVFIPFNAIK